MGITDLFNNLEKKEEYAKKQIIDNENIILQYINEYHMKNNPNENNQILIHDLLLYVKGDLLKTYISEYEKKDKELKYFFKGEYFKEKVMFSITKIYNLDRQSKTVSRRHRELDQGAIESLNQIFEYANKFDSYQRKR